MIEVDAEGLSDYEAIEVIGDLKDIRDSAKAASVSARRSPKYVFYTALIDELVTYIKEAR